MIVIKTKKGNLDKRYRANRVAIHSAENYNKRQYRHLIVSVAILGALFGAIFASWLYSYTHKSKVDSRTVSEVIVPEVKAFEIPCDYDPLTYLRCKGQKLGIDDVTITKFIQVMKCESGLRPDAINKNTNGTFDLGIAQINDVHSKKISRADRLDFVKNIDYAYKLFQAQGFTPWVCARKLGIN